ncbi:hypothetical protein ACQQ2N_14330 [Dokdonella sp. MW10]|uniref:hypothetical protein n=1 Tax=Dokdonella sp. MW10 TaxID=2992926 RepID=UPI003F7E3584
MLSLDRKSLALVLIGLYLFALTEAEAMQRFKYGSKSICVASDMAVRKLDFSGAFGTSLGSDNKGVFVSIPFDSKSEEGKEVLLFIKIPKPSEEKLPSVSHSQVLSDIPGLSELPSESTFGERRFVAGDYDSPLGDYYVSCRELPGSHKCSRPFRYQGIAGAYSFNWNDIHKWSSIESVVIEAFKLGQVGVCKGL